MAMMPSVRMAQISVQRSTSKTVRSKNVIVLNLTDRLAAKAYAPLKSTEWLLSIIPAAAAAATTTTTYNSCCNELLSHIPYHCSFNLTTLPASLYSKCPLAFYNPVMDCSQLIVNSFYKFIIKSEQRQVLPIQLRPSMTTIDSTTTTTTTATKIYTTTTNN
eukprot:gene7932-10025_t